MSGQIRLLQVIEQREPAARRLVCPAVPVPSKRCWGGGGLEGQAPRVSVCTPPQQLIRLGFSIRELCLLVQNFIFLCHSPITTFHFPSGGGSRKCYINTVVKGTHCTSDAAVCPRGPPAAGLTSLCLPALEFA